jgi:hypothetical protein
LRLAARGARSSAELHLDGETPPLNAPCTAPVGGLWAQAQKLGPKKSKGISRSHQGLRSSHAGLDCWNAAHSAMQSVESRDGTRPDFPRVVQAVASPVAHLTRLFQAGLRHAGWMKRVPMKRHAGNGLVAAWGPVMRRVPEPAATPWGRSQELKFLGQA